MAAVMAFTAALGIEQRIAMGDIYAFITVYAVLTEKKIETGKRFQQIGGITAVLALR